MLARAGGEWSAGVGVTARCACSCRPTLPSSRFTYSASILPTQKQGRKQASHYHTSKITLDDSFRPATCSICVTTRAPSRMLEGSTIAYAVSGPGRPAVSTRVQIYLASRYRSTTYASVGPPWFIHEDYMYQWGGQEPSRLAVAVRPGIVWRGQTGVSNLA
jgi:hypothetical protein